jgi:tetratricopeptide (TPR) repeat protein
VAPEKAFAAANAWPWQSPSLQESLAAALIQEEKYQEAKQCLEQAIKGLDSYAVHRLLLYCARTEDATAVYRAARNCLYRCPDDSEVWGLLMKNCPPEELAFWQSRYIHFLPPVNNQEGDDAE